MKKVLSKESDTAGSTPWKTKAAKLARFEFKTQIWQGLLSKQSSKLCFDAIISVFNSVFTVQLCGNTVWLNYKNKTQKKRPTDRAVFFAFLVRFLNPTVSLPSQNFESSTAVYAHWGVEAVPSAVDSDQRHSKKLSLASPRWPLQRVSHGLPACTLRGTWGQPAERCVTADYSYLPRSTIHLR